MNALSYLHQAAMVELVWGGRTLIPTYDQACMVLVQACLS